MSAFIRHLETTERPLPLNQTIQVAAQRVALLATLASPACVPPQKADVPVPVFEISTCDNSKIEESEGSRSSSNPDCRRFKKYFFGVKVSDFPYMDVYKDGVICGMAKEIADNRCWNSKGMPLILSEQEIDARRAQFGWAPKTDSVLREGARVVNDGHGMSFHEDRNGHPLYTQRYDQVDYFHEGAAVVRNHPNYQHIDKTGRPLYKQFYEDAQDFHEGAAAVKLNNKWFHIDKTGQALYGERYDSCFLDGGLDFHDGIASACLDGKQFHITLDGKPLYSERYDYVGYQFQEGVVPVIVNYTYPGEKRLGPDGPAFHIDKHGRPIYKAHYEWVDDFSQGVARARLGYEYFHIDKKGQPVYKERFDLVHDFHNGVTVGRQGDQWYLLKALKKSGVECDVTMTKTLK